MPEATLEIIVSFREMYRPRLLQAVARLADGAPAAGLSLHLDVADGSFDDEVEMPSREIVTGSDGAVFFQWYESPSTGRRRNLVSVVRATWESSDTYVYIENMYE